MPSPSQVQPNYVALVRFLVEPFLESPDSLRIDCETYADRQRVWVRLSFSGSDKGRVFGRGGRTFQAIRTVVEAAARAVEQSIHLEVYGAHEQSSSSNAPVKDGPKRRSSG